METKNKMINPTVSSSSNNSFHLVHKVPYGDSPYVQAKHAQLIEKNQEKAVVWFWKAINEGDRVESALKDVALALKLLNRSQEAIEAIKSFRGLCSTNPQHSLDNILIDLYKKCGRYNEQIELLKKKLRQIYQGETFNGKPTKTARSHGKKFQVTVKQEISRLLGNLGWAYMRQSKYMSAEAVYKKAQMIDPDANKACNLASCLIKQSKYDEARSALEDVLEFRVSGSGDCRTRQRAEELLVDVEFSVVPLPDGTADSLGLGGLDEDFVNGLERLMDQWGPFRTKRLPIFEEISSFRNQLVC